jgi:hypothetical protein
MDATRRRLSRSGVESLTLGILTVLFGVAVGVLNIVNGGKLLRQKRSLR